MGDDQIDDQHLAALPETKPHELLSKYRLNKIIRNEETNCLLNKIVNFTKI